MTLIHDDNNALNFEDLVQKMQCGNKQGRKIKLRVKIEMYSMNFLSIQ